MKINKELIKEIARGNGVTLTDKEIENAHKSVSEELLWEEEIGDIESAEEEYYYRMKQYFC